MDRYLRMRVNVLDVSLDSSKFEKGASDAGEVEAGRPATRD